MAKITPEYIRKSFLRQFSRMTPERREGTIEALTVLHEERQAETEPQDDEADPPAEAQPALPMEAEADPQ